MHRWPLVLMSILSMQVNAQEVRAYFNQNQQTSYTEPYRGILRQGDNLEQVLITHIYSAKKSIYIAVQELRLPLVAKALIEKWAQGVDVRVVLENSYNFTVLDQRDTSSENEYEATKLNELRAFVDMDRNGKITKNELLNRDAVYMLKAAKIPLMDDTFDGTSGSGLMHHKFMVVDGMTVVTGSANFTMSCIHGDTLVLESRGNANSLVVIESAAVARLFTYEFAQLWGDGKRGYYGQNKSYRAAQTLQVGRSKVTVQFSPTSTKFQWLQSVNGLIAKALNTAKYSVKAALFVYSDQNLSNILEKKHETGVQMGVLVEPKFAYRDYSELLDMMGLQMLNQRCNYETSNNPWKNPAKEVGMAVLPKGDVLHHKFAVVDDSMVVVGSQNWSEAANYINDETLLVIQDPTISELYTQEYERIKRRGFLGPPPALMTEIKRLETECARRGLTF